ncbi:hypothetical protein K4K54_005595 [Colletotrichum sp. SAR 10_86]|nr:hypothetical protein K4K52_005189 [Colletotrichum sp. SAR 10_76]KAI8224009.1 hypothetical protein K4K54_005595 [Colletotrichum sp. SAR 10_86]
MDDAGSNKQWPVTVASTVLSSSVSPVYGSNIPSLLQPPAKFEAQGFTQRGRSRSSRLLSPTALAARTPDRFLSMPVPKPACYSKPQDYPSYPCQPNLPPSTSVTRSFSARNRPINEEEGRADPSFQRSKSVNHHNVPSGLRRSGSLNQRYNGDMSHRPLDMLKKEHRAADRAPHLRTRKNGPMTDTIDGLDTIGGVYHHGGPYDATLASRNRNKQYAPVEAVKESNEEALRATPREYIQDSLTKHVPLQGTGTVPVGSSDMRGNVMNYEEGADLMREPDAQGGAYKRWDGIPYHPDDLKGKGEPSYTYERDLKEKKRMRKASLGNGPVEYEMHPGANSQSRKNLGATVRQRSVSNAADGRPGPSETPTGQSNSADVRRHNSTGKRLSDGLKRRFGSIRRKHQAAA